MGIFDSISQAVLDAQRAVQGTAPAADGGAGAAAGGGVAGILAPGGEPVDVVAVLTARQAAKGGPALNWKTSIADLMRLLDLDPSLEHRKALATELGYTGALDGSAEMNIWLHRKVMEGLAANGGNEPFVDGGGAGEPRQRQHMTFKAGLVMVHRRLPHGTRRRQARNQNHGRS